MDHGRSNWRATQAGRWDKIRQRSGHETATGVVVDPDNGGSTEREDWLCSVFLQSAPDGTDANSCRGLSAVKHRFHSEYDLSAHIAQWFGWNVPLVTYLLQVRVA